MPPTRPQPLAVATDAHGLNVWIERDADHGDGLPAVLLSLGRTSTAFDLDDPTQRAGLVALRDALDGILGDTLGRDEPEPAPEGWRLSRLDHVEDSREIVVALPDEFVCTDNVIEIEGERLRMVWVSTYSRTLFVRPESA